MKTTIAISKEAHARLKIASAHSDKSSLEIASAAVIVASNRLINRAIKESFKPAKKGASK